MNIFEYLNARATRNTSIDLLIARTQRSISIATLLILAGVVAALFYLTKIDQLVKELLIFVLGALIGNYATMVGFWYGRPRGAGVPDPSLTETKTTETKTVETTTAPLPPVNKTEGES